jgi:hypothetical protein
MIVILQCAENVGDTFQRVAPFDSVHRARDVKDEHDALTANVQ